MGKLVSPDAPASRGKGVYRFSFEYRRRKDILWRKHQRVFSVTQETVDKLIHADMEMLQVIAYMTQPDLEGIRNLEFDQIR